MRGILLGTDFMYNKKGELVPIQINTSVGHNNNDRIEDDNYVFDLSLLKDIIEKNNFKTIVYIGSIIPFKNRLSEVCVKLGKSLSYYKVEPPSLTVPSIKDYDDLLVIRSAYDTTAIVDDTYCRNRSNFLNLIKDLEFGSEFAYINHSGELINNIKTIPDNDGHPNFIMKSVYTIYDRNQYPKLYNVTNDTELQQIIEKVSPNYFLMPFYFNEDKIFDGYTTTIRSLNILFAPNLESVPFGLYTKRSENKLNKVLSKKFELTFEERSSYITTDDKLEINKSKTFLSQKIITDIEKNKMNDIMTKIGNKIIIENT